jgi:hypothetical protein
MPSWGAEKTACRSPRSSTSARSPLSLPRSLRRCKPGSAVLRAGCFWTHAPRRGLIEAPPYKTKVAVTGAWSGVTPSSRPAGSPPTEGSSSRERGCRSLAPRASDRGCDEYTEGEMDRKASLWRPTRLHGERLQGVSDSFSTSWGEEAFILSSAGLIIGAWTTLMHSPSMMNTRPT